MSFTIGISGMDVAQRAIETIGTNIANASTDGYHRQDLNIVPADYGSTASRSPLGGARIAGTTRAIDVLLENEILRQRPIDGQISQELQTLQSIEQSLGTLDSQGLAQSLGKFYDSMRQLSAQPDSRPLQEQAVWSGESLAGEFRRMGRFLEELDMQIRLQAQSIVAKANGLAAQIGQLNTEIQGMSARGQNSNILQDTRDQAVSELAALVDVQVDRQSAQGGVVNVMAWGMPLVIDGTVSELESGLDDAGELGVGLAGSSLYQTDAEGGQVGGLMNLKNSTLQDLRDNLSTLARQVVQSVNELHVQGVGSAGSFTDLTGEPVAADAVSTWDPPVTAGNFYVRITRASDGAVFRKAVAVGAADTAANVATTVNALRIDGVQTLTAGVADSRLHIQAAGGYTFDFIPAPTPQATTSTLTGTSAPAITGQYDGAANQTYTFTVLGGATGSVSLAGSLQVQVKNGGNQVVRTLEVGQGYATGERLEIDHGLYVSFDAGTLNGGETFTVDAVADSDPTGFLAAAGINTFFRGASTATIDVRQQLMDDPGRLACASGADGLDNQNITRIADLQTAASAALGDKAPLDYYDQLVASLGQKVQIQKARKSAMDGMMQQMENQRSAISGVDVNDEAAKLMVFERMFQSMAKYLTAVDQTMDYLTELIG